MKSNVYYIEREKNLKIKYLSNTALKDLTASLQDNTSHYFENNTEWFNTYFSQPNVLITSKIDFNEPAFVYDDDYATSDFKNVKAMYEAFKHLTVTEATQEQLWASLAHVQLKQFFDFRMKEYYSSKNEKRLRSALFFTHGAKRSLFVHILARYWWVGYMTYDETNEANPYWLTEFFCQREFSSRIVYFFSSNFTNNREITKGVLSALKQLNDEGYEMKREHFLEAERYLNVIGGAMILDILTKEEIQRRIYNRIINFFNLTQKLLLNKTTISK